MNALAVFPLARNPFGPAPVLRPGAAPRWRAREESGDAEAMHIHAEYPAYVA
jgi:hypothetical protein